MGSTSFEWFVAARYLRARRKEKVVSVVTVISVIGVWAGVMALVISLAVNNGFRDMLQRSSSAPPRTSASNEKTQARALPTGANSPRSCERYRT